MCKAISPKCRGEVTSPLHSRTTYRRSRGFRGESRRLSGLPLKWIYRHPRLYDLLDTVINLGLSNKARAQLVKSLKGRVLEVGVGSGKSIPFFNGEEFFGVDNSIYMLKRAKRHTHKLCVASAYNLPFKARNFDKVLFIYTLCTLKFQREALNEAFRAGDKIIVLDFKLLPKLVEVFGRKVFGSSKISEKLLKDFSSKSYFYHFKLYYKEEEK